ncbi:MAG TPA: DUF3159 domain-containing protein [Pseudonocardiaceae bacterium]
MTQSGPTSAAQSPQPPPAPEAEPALPDDRAVPDRTDGSAAPAETDEKDEPQQTLLEQMGGIGGLVYSSVPVLVFVAVFLPSHSLAASIWSSVGSAVAILVWRLIRREPIQPAISGIFGVAVAAFIAYRTGSARGYFLFGIWTSLAYGAAFLLSVAVRWPLAGVVWSALNSTGMGWRSDRLGRRYYDVATGVWVLVFGARFVVQHWLYVANEVGWLGVARIAMGWPLTAIAALVTVWAVRKADQRQKELAGPAEAEPLPDAGA